MIQVLQFARSAVADMRSSAFVLTLLVALSAAQDGEEFSEKGRTTQHLYLVASSGPAAYYCQNDVLCLKICYSNDLLRHFVKLSKKGAVSGVAATHDIGLGYRIILGVVA